MSDYSRLDKELLRRRACDEKEQEQEKEKETREGEGEGGRDEGAVPPSTPLGWLVTPPCTGSGGRSQCWKVVPDEKPSRRTLILEGLDAPSSTLQRGFNPRDPRNNHPALVHPFACRSLLRMVPSTVWPERDVCRSFFPFFPTNTMSFSSTLSFSLSLSLRLSFSYSFIFLLLSA